MKKLICAFDGIMSGVLLCIGCAVFIASDSTVIGGFLFSLGLCAIIRFGFNLYTGKVGYVVTNKPGYILDVIMVLIGNIVGTAIGGNLLRLTRFGDMFAEKAASITQAKFSDDPLSIFVLALFCGILMYVAVDGNRRAAEKGDHIGGLFFIVVPVVVFIICGFNHCVADLAYFFISGMANLSDAPVYFIFVILGNAVGCMAIPFLQKISSKMKMIVR